MPVGYQSHLVAHRVGVYTGVFIGEQVELGQSSATAGCLLYGAWLSSQ